MSDTRTKQIIFHVNAHEDEMIKLKMEQTGIRNRSVYLRKMAIDGMIINLDLTEFRKMLHLMTRTAENVNQIAKRCNATGNLYEADVRELLERIQRGPRPDEECRSRDRKAEAHREINEESWTRQTS